MSPHEGNTFGLNQKELQRMNGQKPGAFSLG